MRPKPICTIGKKSLCGWNKSDIIRYLKREQEKDNPAWFDGSHFYFLSGKYSLTMNDRGRPSLKKLHNLSLEGIFNHFPELPCDYIAYNAKAEEVAHERWEANRQKELEQANKERQRLEEAKQEDQEIQELAETIENWIAKNPIKAKKGVFQTQHHLDKSKGTVGEDTEGKIVDNLLAIHKPDKSYRVSHVPTGGVLKDFDTEKECRRFISSVINLVDWDFTDPNYVYELPSSVIMNLAAYCRNDRIHKERLEQIVATITHKIQSQIK